jgi:NAD(P) transhydrogenase subunit beta
METFAQLLYLVAAVLFFLGLKKQARVKTARLGNQLASLAMLVAIVATLIYIPASQNRTIDWTLIIVGLVVGGAIGAFAARRVAMTAMPEMVALFNGSGGIASSLVALAVLFALIGRVPDGLEVTLDAGPGGWASALGLILSVLVGGVTFAGSLVAFGKLAGKVVPDQPVLLPARHVVNGLVLAAMIVLGVLLGFVVDVGGVSYVLALLLLLASFALGVLLVHPDRRRGHAGRRLPAQQLLGHRGGRDRLRRSATTCCSSPGALVGAAGLILTQIMCKAMNRSLGQRAARRLRRRRRATGDAREYTNVTESSRRGGGDDARRRPSRDLRARATASPSPRRSTRSASWPTSWRSAASNVRYAIHPVAGRMPGHMNVLLAEADVPYEQLVELDEINGDFKNTDVVIVVGANDVVNPSALDDETSPIWGMPILNVHEARTVFVIKRSLAAGFAAVRNELFDYDNAYMLFGDAKKMLQEMLTAIREG